MFTPWSSGIVSVSPVDVFDLVLVLIGIALGALLVLAIRVRDEERRAQERKLAPEVWIIDRAGYWWAPLDCGGYVPVRPEPVVKRRRLDPDIPPCPVSRAWVDREIGIKDVYDAPNILNLN